MKISKKKLTRELLKCCEGMKVKVIFFNNTTVEGVLELGNGYFYEPKKYFVDHICFRLSHIKSIEVEE